MAENRTIRIGTRKSQLAMIQAEHVQEKLQHLFPDIRFVIVAMSTTGDQILDVALSKIGEKSLFTKELEHALEKNQVDMVVHSLKDLPSVLPPRMVIGAIMQREDPRDVLILRKDLHESGNYTLSNLPDGAIIGTSAVRRVSQFKANHPTYSYQNIRGNLNTRLRKLDNKEGADYSAIILAAAGVHRMGWSSRISQYIDIQDCMHAVGQGALGIECMQEDVEVLNIVAQLNHLHTMAACVAERAIMRTLEGGCSAPVASHAEIVDDQELVVKSGVWSLDGTERLVMDIKVKLDLKTETVVSRRDWKWNTNRMFSSVSCHTGLHDILEASESAGIVLGRNMLGNGAGKILETAKRDNENFMWFDNQCQYYNNQSTDPRWLQWLPDNTTHRLVCKNEGTRLWRHVSNFARSWRHWLIHSVRYCLVVIFLL